MPLAGWRTSGTNRRAVGSLDLAHEEFVPTGLPPKAEWRGQLEECSSGCQFSCNCLYVSPRPSQANPSAPLSPHHIMAQDPGLSQPKRKLGHGMQRQPSPRMEPGLGRGSSHYYTYSSSASEEAQNSVSVPLTPRYTLRVHVGLACPALRPRNSYMPKSGQRGRNEQISRNLRHAKTESRRNRQFE